MSLKQQKDKKKKGAPESAEVLRPLRSKRYNLPQPVTVKHGDEEHSLKTLESFELFTDEHLEAIFNDVNEDGSALTIEIEMANLLHWHDGTIEGVARLSRDSTFDVVYTCLLYTSPSPRDRG